jgi:hypothetical protein
VQENPSSLSLATNPFAQFFCVKNSFAAPHVTEMSTSRHLLPQNGDFVIFCAKVRPLPVRLAIDPLASKKA